MDSSLWLKIDRYLRSNQVDPAAKDLADGDFRLRQAMCWMNVCVEYS